MSATEVDRHLQRFDGAVAAAHARLLEAVHQEVTGSLAAAARTAAQEHSALAEAAGFLGHDTRETAERDREHVWRQVRRYVDGVRERVIEPLHDRLAELDAGQRLADCWAEARRAYEAAACEAPDEVVRDEPEGTYLRHAGDNPLRRSSKAVVRVGRSLAAAGRRVRNLGRRLVGRDPLPPPSRRQSVPVRALLRYHVAFRVVPRDAAILEALRQRLAKLVSDCERDASAWADTCLEADATLDTPDHHASRPSGPAPHAEGSESAGQDVPVDPAIHADSVVHVAAALGRSIESLGEVDLLAGLDDDLASALDEARPVLQRDLRHVGTFMLDPGDRDLPARPTRATRDADKREAQWTGWFRQVVSRMELDLHLLRVRGGFLSLLDDFELDVERAVVSPVCDVLEETGKTVESVRGRVESCLEEARAVGQGADLGQCLTTARDDVTSTLEAKVLEPLDPIGFSASIRKCADERVNQIMAILTSLPEGLVVHPPAPPSEGPLPDEKPAEIRLRQIAEQAYDAVLLERSRVAPDPLVAAVDRIRSETRQLESVVRFNLDSALDELGGDKHDPVERLNGAEELALNGLDRTLGTLEELRRGIVSDLSEFRHRLFAAHAQGWEQFHGRVRVDDRVQEQILDLNYRVRAGLRARAAALDERLRRASRWGMRWVRLGWSRGMKLVRLGQSALEGERVTEEQKRRTIDALSTLGEVLGDLPLVYRRLFSFQPVTDAAMLEGRSWDLDAVAVHFEHWRKGLTDAFVVTGYDGNGRTSFLNVVLEKILRGADVRRVRLTERILDERVLAGRLAAELDLDDGNPWTLDRLASALPDRRLEGGKPLACVVENLEHLFLRTSADNGLVGPFLAFMSRTDSSVFWLATLAEPAWTYIEKVEATTACLVRRHPLRPLGRDELEAAIMNRHRRSGLGLEFQAPSQPPPLLRRRLRRARGDKERQAILRADYFDQLSRLAGQNLLLALFYWVRSVQLEPETSRVSVRAIEPISFAFIDAFTLSQSFTLKAFLEHATLTLEEHDRIFGISRPESHHMFESLGNLLVIEPAVTSERVGEFVFTTIDDEQRYRIRPLVMHPVLTHLHSKNIVS